MKIYLHILILGFLLNTLNIFSQTFGFEDGTSNGWSDFRGQTLGFPEATITGLQPIGTGAIEITSGGDDQFLSNLGVNISTLSPIGGSHSLKLEDYQVGGLATQVKKTFTVTEQTALYVYHYAVMLEDPGHEGRPFFKVEVEDQNGNLVPCGEYIVIASNPANDGFSALAGQGVGGMTTYWYKDWTYVAVNLETYIGQDITITFTVGDCSAGEHMAYAYIDETVSPLEPTIADYCPGDEELILEAPDGFLSYIWWTPTPMFDQTAVIQNPEALDSVWVEMQSELGNCPVTMTVYLNNLPIADPFFENSTACVGNDMYFTNNSNANGATIIGYLWDFGDSTATSTDENPTHNYSETGVYNVNFQITTDSGCIKDTTISITVGCCVPTTTFNYIVDPCGGTQVTFNYSGTADSTYDYNWNFGSGIVISGSGQGPIVVDFNTEENYNVNLEVTNIVNGINCDTTSENKIIVLNDPLNFDVEITNIRCYGFSDGEIDLTITGGTSPYSYSWRNLPQTTQDLTSLSAGLYTVTVTDTNNCSITESFTLTQPSLLESQIHTTNLSCYNSNNGQIDLDINGGVQPYQYNWSNGVHTKNNYNLISGTYSVTVADANNCILTASTYISEPDEIIVSRNVTDIPCFNYNTGSIDVIVNGDFPPFDFHWSTNETSQNISNLAAGIYSLTVTDSTNCYVVTSINVMQPERLTVELPHDFYYCNDSNIPAIARGGVQPYHYSWNVGQSGSSINIYPSQETTYIVTVTDQNNCEITESVVVSVYPELSLNVLVNKDSICPNENVIVDIFPEGGSGNYMSFYNGNIINNHSSITVTSNGDLIFVTHDNCNNYASDTISIFIASEIPIEYVSDVYSGCEPLNVNFKPTSVCSDCEYNWVIEDVLSNDSVSNNYPSHFYETAGFYDVTCYITDKYGCRSFLKKNDMINVFPLPKAYAYANPLVVNIFDSEVEFFNNSEGADYYNWNFMDGFISNAKNISHEFTEIGYYDVILTAYTIHGCFDTTKIKIQMKDELTFYAPTAFSTGGNGVNDLFHVFGNGIDNNNFKLIIYDRWGEPIFESTDIYRGWDGRAKNSSEFVETGTYTWICIFNDFTNKKHKKTGAVTVLR